MTQWFVKDLSKLTAYKKPDIRVFLLEVVWFKLWVIIFVSLKNNNY